MAVAADVAATDAAALAGAGETLEAAIDGVRPGAGGNNPDVEADGEPALSRQAVPVQRQYHQPPVTKNAPRA